MEKPINGWFGCSPMLGNLQDSCFDPLESEHIHHDPAILPPMHCWMLRPVRHRASTCLPPTRASLTHVWSTQHLLPAVPAMPATRGTSYPGADPASSALGFLGENTGWFKLWPLWISASEDLRGHRSWGARVCRMAPYDGLMLSNQHGWPPWKILCFCWWENDLVLTFLRCWLIQTSHIGISWFAIGFLILNLRNPTPNLMNSYEFHFWFCCSFGRPSVGFFWIRTWHYPTLPGACLVMRDSLAGPNVSWIFRSDPAPLAVCLRPRVHALTQFHEQVCSSVVDVACSLLALIWHTKKLQPPKGIGCRLLPNEKTNGWDHRTNTPRAKKSPKPATSWAKRKKNDATIRCLEWVALVCLGAEYQSWIFVWAVSQFSHVTTKKTHWGVNFQSKPCEFESYSIHMESIVWWIFDSPTASKALQLLTILVHWSRQVTASVYNMHPQTLVPRLHPQCSACRPASSAATFFIQALASDDLTSKLIPLPIGIMLHGWPVIDFRPNCGFEFCLWQCWKWKFHSAQFDRISGFWSGPKETDTWTFRFKAHTFLVISALKFLNPLINHHFPHGKGNFKVSIFGDTLTVDFCVWT